MDVLGRKSTADLLLRVIKTKTRNAVGQKKQLFFGNYSGSILRLLIRMEL